MDVVFWPSAANDFSRTFDELRRIQIGAGGSKIVLEETPGGAVQLTVQDVEGGRPIVDLTIRAGPPGED